MKFEIHQAIKVLTISETYFEFRALSFGGSRLDVDKL